MQYALLGNAVSRLAFGAMTFTAGNKDMGAIDKVGADLACQLEDNLKAAAVTLDAAEVADLDAATPLAPVYPNFFMDDIAIDRPLAEALGGRMNR